MTFLLSFIGTAVIFEVSLLSLILLALVTTDCEMEEAMEVSSLSPSFSSGLELALASFILLSLLLSSVLISFLPLFPPLVLTFLVYSSTFCNSIII